MPQIFSNGSFKLRVTMSTVILRLFLPVLVSGTGQDLPWARITAAPAAATQSLDRRDYDTANSRLYGYTSVGMDGTKTIWSAKMCEDIAPTMLIETFQNTVFGLCWAVSTVNLLDLYATTASADYITACSGQIAIGTSTTWDCSTLGNCIFNTIYPDLASTSLTLGATCVQNTAGNTYIHATTFPTATLGPTPTGTGSLTGTSGGGASGLSTNDIITLAVGLGVGITTLLLMLCAWLCPCMPWRISRRRRHDIQMHHITDEPSSDASTK